MSSRPVVQRSTGGRRIGLSLMLLLGMAAGLRAGDPPALPAIQGAGPAPQAADEGGGPTDVQQALSILKNDGKTPAPAATPVAPAAATTAPGATCDVQQVGCPTCGGGHAMDTGPGLFNAGGAFSHGGHKEYIGIDGPAPGSCGCDNDDCGGCPIGQCYPGWHPCDCCCDSKYLPVRCVASIVQAICCPDPCYEGQWFPLADAAFFTDAARPVTQMRMRVDFARDVQFPDRSEFLWAQIGSPTGPTPKALNGTPEMAPAGQKAARGVSRINYADFRMYNEAALGNFGFFIDTPFRSVDVITALNATDAGGVPANQIADGSGFADMVLGTKTLLLDSEMVQLAFQFKTYLPTGNGPKGLGTQHVSLEPGLVKLFKLAPNLYTQMQVSYRIPIGGNPGFQGGVVSYHGSLNTLLWNCGETIQVVGSLEAGGYEFLNGLYTDPTTGAQLKARDVGDVFEVGAGTRFVICNKIDVGVGAIFSVTKDSYASEFYRMDFRWRF